MEYVYLEQALLDVLDEESWAESPEQLLERLETSLEEGTLTVEEVAQYLNDLHFNKHTYRK